MRNYIARIELIPSMQGKSSGAIAEWAFSEWFYLTYQGEALHKQKADNDYNGIDFIDEKGIKYQVKGTQGRTFTFNCSLELLERHLTCDQYVCIQVHKKYAYIESIYTKKNILNLAKPSFNYKKSCFIWAKDLKQYKLEL